MKDQFYLYFEKGMPKGTSQQIRHNSKTGNYFKDNKLASTEAQFFTALKPHAPKVASTRPIRLFIVLYFDKKSPKKLWGRLKTTRPDVDNFCKALIDQMSHAEFWRDDAQVADLHIIKRYAETASIYIEWSEVNE